MPRNARLLTRRSATAPHHDGRQRTVRVTVWLTAAMMVGTLAAGLWVATSVFEHTPHVEDELAYLFQAKTLAEGHLTAPSPPVTSTFFVTPFTIDDGEQWYGKYTPGYPLVLAFGVKIGAPWLVNPLAAALAVGLTVLLGTRVYGRRTGLLAGALVALSPMALVHSGTFFSHNVALCLTLGALLAAERVWRTGSQLAGLTAGACLGMLLLTRPYAAAAVAAPLAVAAVVHVWRRRQWRPTLAATGVLVIASGVLLMYNEHTTGSSTRFGYEVYWPYDRVGFGPGHGRTTDGHTLSVGWRNTEENLRQLREWLFGWPGGTDLLPVVIGVLVTLVAVASATWIVVRAHVVRGRGEAASAESAGSAGSTEQAETDCAATSSRRPALGFDLLLLGVALAPIVAHLAYWTHGAVHGPRYYFEGIAAMALLAARAARHLASWVQHIGATAELSRRAVAAAFLLLSVVGLATTTLDRFDDSREYYGVTTDDLEAVEALDLHDALVFVEVERWTDFEPFAAANSPFLDTDVVYAANAGERNLLLIDAMPGRTAYLWADGRLTPIADVTP